MDKMKIKQRIDELALDDNVYSNFYLVCFDGDNLDEPNEVYPIENNSKNISFDGRKTLLTDKDGNVLRIFYRDYISILLVNKEDIIIKEDKDITRRNRTTRVTDNITRYNLSTYEHKLYQTEVLFNSQKESLFKVEVPDTKSNIILLRTTNGIKTRARLYSLDIKEYITPDFNDLESLISDGKTIFKFKDDISSKETIHGEPFKSKIIGFVDERGRFADGILFEFKNEVRETSLNEHPLFLQYKSLKHYLSIELDEEVEKEINKMHSQNSQLKRLEKSLNQNN
jgi:hypothetical protein